MQKRRIRILYSDGRTKHKIKYLTISNHNIMCVCLQEMLKYLHSFEYHAAFYHKRKDNGGCFSRIHWDFVLPLINFIF